MREADVVVVGAGLAGLQCARLIARAGARVVLVDRKCSPAGFIHTTGIFVRRTFEDFHFPQETLGPPVRTVVLHAPSGRAATFVSDRDEFRVGRMRELYRAMLADGQRAGVEYAGGLSFAGAEKAGDRTNVVLRRGSGVQRISARLIVGADGAHSRVAGALGLPSTRRHLAGVEEVARRRNGSREAALHCFLDTSIAPGYLAWIADDGEEVHLGAAGDTRHFSAADALRRIREIAATLDLGELEVVERRGGRIPVGGVLPRIASRRGLLVGDAAGAVSPLTAGGLDAAIRLSAFAAQCIADSLQNGRPLETLYSGARFRPRFVSRLWMRRLFAFTPDPLLDAAVGLLAHTPLRAVGNAIFFGHGSFPIGREELSAPFRTVTAPA